jgi:toxin-antitoxin system PIN domain toxin
MTGLDTNLLLYSRVEQSPWHRPAAAFLESLHPSTEVVIAELVLVELYVLLRNPAVVSVPYTAAEAARECQIFRSHPHWSLAESADVMEKVWLEAGKRTFARRRIFDARLAYTLQDHGVTDFATANVKDFEGLGFARVWNPLK